MGTRQQTFDTLERLERRRRQFCWLSSLNGTVHLTSLGEDKTITGMKENSPWQGLKARLDDFEKPDSWNKGLALASKFGQNSDEVSMAQLTPRTEM